MRQQTLQCPDHTYELHFVFIYFHSPFPSVHYTFCVRYSRAMNPFHSIITRLEIKLHVLNKPTKCIQIKSCYTQNISGPCICGFTMMLPDY